MMNLNLQIELPPLDPAALRRQRRWIENLYQRYHRPEYLTSDPLQFLYDYPRPADREVVGLIASCLAYGNVLSINKGIRGVLQILSPSPRDWIVDTPEAQIRKAFAGFRYRVTDAGQFTGLLIGIRRLIVAHVSLHASFARGFHGEEATILPALQRWVELFGEVGGHALPHLLPAPARGSACKRLCLYLRWMVRHDAIDPGGWTDIPAGALVVPLDTHLHRVAAEAGWTTRRSGDLRTAIQVTACLRRFDARDPLRFDFALTRPGILRESCDD